MERGRMRATPRRRLVGLVVTTAAVGGAGWTAASAVTGSGMPALAQSALLLLLGCVLLVAAMLLPLLLVGAFREWRTQRLLESVADHDDEAPWLSAIYRHLDRAA